MNADQLAAIPRHILFDRHGEKLPAYLRARGLCLSLAELDAERHRRHRETSHDNRGSNR